MDVSYFAGAAYCLLAASPSAPTPVATIHASPNRCSTLVYTAAMGLSFGVTAMVARRIGEKSRKRQPRRRAGHHARRDCSGHHRRRRRWCSAGCSVSWALLPK